jgi:TonB family protein
MKNLILFFSSIFVLFGCSSSQLIQPVLKENVVPVYPYEAKKNGLEGTVEVIIQVNESGDVTNTKVFKSSGHEILDEASLEYTKTLKFEPASLSGMRTPVFITWKIDYKLDGVYSENGKISILAFSKTADKHESIKAGQKALRELAAVNNFDIDFSEDSTVFNDAALSKFNVILFLNTSGNILDENGEKAFQKFIHNRGGFVGLHGALDTEYDWEWYGKLIGTHCKGSEETHKAVVRVINKNHPSTEDLPYTWEAEAEWCMLTNKLADDVKILAVIDEVTVQGEKMLFSPYCWYHEFDGGRAWYTSGGNKAEDYSSPLFRKHLVGGIKYAAGVE